MSWFYVLMMILIVLFAFDAVSSDTMQNESSYMNHFVAIAAIFCLMLFKRYCL